MEMNLKEFLQEQKLHLKKKKHGPYFEVLAIEASSETLI